MAEDSSSADEPSGGEPEAVTDASASDSSRDTPSKQECEREHDEMQVALGMCRGKKICGISRMVGCTKKMRVCRRLGVKEWSFFFQIC